MVTALTATSTGSSDASMSSKSMSTEVSSSPRSGRGGSATRLYVLARGSVEILAEAPVVDPGSGIEHRHGGLGGHEAVPSQRRQLANGYAVAGDDECLTFVELAHDLATLVSQFSLRDLARHRQDCSTSCYERHAGLRPSRIVPSGIYSVVEATPI